MIEYTSFNFTLLKGKVRVNSKTEVSALLLLFILKFSGLSISKQRGADVWTVIEHFLQKFISVAAPFIMNTNTFHEIDIERKRLYMENENIGVSDSVVAHEEGRRKSRRKKGKVEYRKMEEKYNQILDEEDATEKSKVGVGISEKKPIPVSIARSNGRSHIFACK